MASVRGTDPCLAAGSDPDCVPPTGTGTQQTLGPVQVGCLGHCVQQRERNGQYWDREKIGQHQRRTHLYQRKKSGLLLLFAFELVFFFTPFFHDFKGIKTKEKDKDKEKQSPDLAIFGRVRTRDPDPDHFGQDFDSGSGCGSAPTDPQSGARLKARIGGTSFAFS